MGEVPRRERALPIRSNAKLIGANMNLIGKIPDILLYPVGWYLTATEWIEKHSHAAFWCGVALVIVAWWL